MFGLEALLYFVEAGPAAERGLFGGALVDAVDARAFEDVGDGGAEGPGVVLGDVYAVAAVDVGIWDLEQGARVEEGDLAEFAIEVLSGVADEGGEVGGPLGRVCGEAPGPGWQKGASLSLQRFSVSRSTLSQEQYPPFERPRRGMSSLVHSRDISRVAPL